MDITSSNTITLVDFIRAEQRKHNRAHGFFTDVLLMIALATKVVSRGVNRAGLAQLLGLTGDRNVQDEEVQKLDQYADDVFTSLLGRSGKFLSMVSEEKESLYQADRGDSDSDYVIALDPLDGSSNIDVNVSIGTIFGIYKRVSEGGKKELKDFRRSGREQIGAGYCIYGSSTMFVFSTGRGVNGFTLDPNIGSFILTNPNMQMPEDGFYYSCNEANSSRWGKGVNDYISYMKSNKSSVNDKTYSSRYVGSLVADFHRTLLKGGIYMYPGDQKSPTGKLRLLYECAPLAFLAEQAGGASTNGKEATLDQVSESIHERSPLFIGSKNMVNKFMEYNQGS